MQVAPTPASAVSSAKLRQAQALRERERLRREAQAPLPGPTGRPAQRFCYSGRASPASIQRDPSDDAPSLTSTPRRYTSARASAATAGGDASTQASPLPTPATRTSPISLWHHTAADLGGILPALAPPAPSPPSPLAASPLVVQGAMAPEADSFEDVLKVAVGMGLTTAALAEKMRRNVQEGRFSREHYVQLWGDRVAQVESERAGVGAAAGEEEEAGVNGESPEAGAGAKAQAATGAEAALGAVSGAVAGAEEGAVADLGSDAHVAQLLEPTERAAQEARAGESAPHATADVNFPYVVNVNMPNLAVNGLDVAMNGVEVVVKQPDAAVNEVDVTGNGIGVATQHPSVGPAVPARAAGNEMRLTANTDALADAVAPEMEVEPDSADGTDNPAQGMRYELDSHPAKEQMGRSEEGQEKAKGAGVGAGVDLVAIPMAGADKKGGHEAMDVGRLETGEAALLAPFAAAPSALTPPTPAPSPSFSPAAPPAIIFPAAPAVPPSLPASPPPPSAFLQRELAAISVAGGPRHPSSAMLSQAGAASDTGGGLCPVSLIYTPHVSAAMRSRLEAGVAGDAGGGTGDPPQVSPTMLTLLRAIDETETGNDIVGGEGGVSGDTGGYHGGRGGGGAGAAKVSWGGEGASGAWGALMAALASAARCVGSGAAGKQPAPSVVGGGQVGSGGWAAGGERMAGGESGVVLLLRAELSDTRGELAGVRGELRAVRDQLASMQAQVDTARGQVVELWGELEALRAALAPTGPPSRLPHSRSKACR